MKKLRKNSYTAALLFLISCTGTVSTKQEYFEWLAKPAHGCIATQARNGCVVTVRYMPPALMAFNDVAGSQAATQPQLDSATTAYKQTLAFVVNIDAAKAAVNEYAGGYQSLKNFVEDMNFNPQKFFSIQSGSNTYSPVLATYENDYGQTQTKTIQVVFTGQNLFTTLGNTNNLTFIFNDKVFGTGINHFDFEWKNLQQAPAIEL